MASISHLILSFSFIILNNLLTPSSSLTSLSKDNSSFLNSLLSLSSSSSSSSSSSFSSSLRTTTICSTDGSNDNTTIIWPPSASSSSHDCIVQNRSDVEEEMMNFLYTNRMPFDVLLSGPLGFSTPKKTNNEETAISSSSSSSSSSSRVVATSPASPPPIPTIPHGIVPVTIQMSLDAKIRYPWTSKIPKDIYFEYVLPHANVDESRTNWRPLISSALSPTISPLLSRSSPAVATKEVIHAVNANLWSSIGDGGGGGGGDDNTKPITFKEKQTPLIYDPMSVIAYRYGSCTGVSLLFVNALRSVGIPARLAGTPAWNGKRENGNHSWVEVYVAEEGRWVFMESAPAAGRVPKVDFDPCEFWFCNEEKFDGSTKVYAARWDKEAAGGVVFPMEWNLGSRDVPGEDRTSVMTALCSQC